MFARVPRSPARQIKLRATLVQARWISKTSAKMPWTRRRPSSTGPLVVARCGPLISNRRASNLLSTIETLSIYRRSLINTTMVTSSLIRCITVIYTVCRWRRAALSGWTTHRSKTELLRLISARKPREWSLWEVRPYSTRRPQVTTTQVWSVLSGLGQKYTLSSQRPRTNRKNHLAKSNCRGHNVVNYKAQSSSNLKW